MSGNGSEKPGFQIGLAMAGAVSAGAYSAGVFDFLIEALNEWQKAKERGEDVPKHDVFISVMSGTSAGGIVGALGLAALAGGARPTHQPVSTRNFPEQACQWPKSWDDAGQQIDFNNCGEHGTPGRPLGGVLESFAQAALTTSAFPFGFQAR